MSPLRHSRIALAVIAALLLFTLAVPLADARLPHARPYRVGGPITLDTDLLSQSGTSAWAIDEYLHATTRLPSLGAVFMAAERKYGVNARFLLAAALHESAWGRSYLSRVKHNLFGYNAYDRDPGRYANAYATYAASIDDTAHFIKDWYLTPGGRWWGGQPTLRSMQQYWSSSGGWGVSVSRIASGIHLATLAGRSIAFAAPVVSGPLHGGDPASVDLAWTGGAVPGGVEFVARWQPVQLDSAVAQATLAGLASGGPASFSLPPAPASPDLASPSGPASPSDAAAGSPSAGASAPPPAVGPSPTPREPPTISPGASVAVAAPATPPAPVADVIIPARRVRTASHSIRVATAAPAEPGTYVLDIELRDAGGGSLPAGQQIDIPGVAVRVWGDRSVRYELKPTTDGEGALIRVTNMGRVPIPAGQIETPASVRVPEVLLGRSLISVTATSADPADPEPVLLVASPLADDLAPGASLAFTIPEIAAATGRPTDWVSVALTVLADPTWLAAYPPVGAWFTAPASAAPPAGPPAPAATPTAPVPSASPAPTPSPSAAPVPPPSPQPAPVTSTYQEHSGAIVYHGSWGNAPYSGYLGGNVAWSKTPGATATFTFTGTSVAWIGPAGPTRGLALVLVDGQAITRVNLWRSSFVARVELFRRSFPTAARHTLTIQVLSMPSHPFVAVDAFQVRS